MSELSNRSDPAVTESVSAATLSTAGVKQRSNTVKILAVCGGLTLTMQMTR